MNLSHIKSILHSYHKKKASTLIDRFSDIAGNQFAGEFNVSGFHNQILALPNNPQSIYGVDRCLRIQEVPDQLHAHLFHMAIFAKSIDLQENFVDPFRDDRFCQLQKDVISQFLEVLSLFKVNLSNVEITYLDGLTFGGVPDGRSRLLKRKYTFPPDVCSKKLLKSTVKLFPIKTIANLDINAEEGSLVGPRLEIAYNGIEIGTIVFDCFKIQHGKLKPINYVSGYAIGIERLAAALENRELIKTIPRYIQAAKLLAKSSKPAESSLFRKEVLTIIFTAEAIAMIPDKLSEKQRERLRKLKNGTKAELTNLGIDENIFVSLISFFKKCKYL